MFNRLSLNVSKLFFTVISGVSQANLLALFINGINLAHSPATKFHGILVDNKLNFAPHIREVCTKLSRGIVVCKKLTLMMPFTAVCKLFFTLIYPFLTYGIAIWGHSSVTQLNRLDVT